MILHAIVIAALILAIAVLVGLSPVGSGGATIGSQPGAGPNVYSCQSLLVNPLGTDEGTGVMALWTQLQLRAAAGAAVLVLAGLLLARRLGHAAGRMP
ncbi:MAG: hypothetical protein M3N17_04525 [Actinomycetota bacterium]|nr:hypothetical protein [Actinomycetota bacterium]